MKKLSVIIPVYNEEATLKELVEKVIRVDLSSVLYEKEILLVNDGSKDRSEEIIHELIDKHSKLCEIRYIKNKQNSGKGFSLKEWFRYSTGDVMIVQDADLEYFPEKDYVPMLKAFEEKKVDFVYWSRTLGMKKFWNNYSSKSFMLWWLAVSLLTTLLSFKKVTDEPTCYKMFDKKLKPYLLMPSGNWFEREPAITMLLLRKWFTYAEIPIHYEARKFDEGKKINWKDGVKALWTLLVRRFKRISKI